MKTTLLIWSLLLPVTALAQSPQGMNEQEMRQMMERMQRPYQQCGFHGEPPDGLEYC